MQKGSTGYNHRPRKRFGQNFLTDQSIVDEILSAADLDPEDTVLEIGPGRGALTHLMAKRAGRLIAIEIDRDLAAELRDEYHDNPGVEIIEGDVLKLDLREVLAGEERIKVVANLPYYITTPILMMLLESELPMERIVVMVQKEVADRMCATCGTSDYGALSLAVAFYTSPHIVCKVPASSFYPAPKVESSVVCLDVRQAPLSGSRRQQLFSCIKAAFAQRRKTLLNALSASDIIDKTGGAQLLSQLGFDVNIRGERLSLEDYIRLSDTIFSMKESGDGH